MASGVDDPLIESDSLWEYLRDMMSPADGPDLTDEELIERLGYTEGSDVSSA